jgi:hypothetical protein
MIRKNKITAIRTNEPLWEDCKIEAIEKMGGTFSARAMQYAVKLYKKRGGEYIGPKSEANSLQQWTEEKWDYVGKPKHSRYLPLKAREVLTSGEKAATSRSKNQGTKVGKQWVPQPENIADKTKKYRQHNQ